MPVRPILMMKNQAIPMAIEAAPALVPSPGSSSGSPPPPAVRKFFPESFLFNDYPDVFDSK